MCKKITVVIIAVLVGLIIKTCRDAGEFNVLTPVNEDKCTVLGKDFIKGPEDLVVDYTHRLLYGSSDDRKLLPWVDGIGGTEEQMSDLIARVHEQGFVFAVDLETMEAKEVNVEGLDVPDFHPHGLGLVEEGENRLLFVINHRRDGDAVEIFDIKSGKTLNFKYSIISPDLFHLNDVYPVSAHAFYVTTWHYYSIGTFMNLVEKFLQRHWTFLSYCEIPQDIPDGTKIVNPKCRKVVENLAVANGVNGSPDKSLVYVVPSLEKSLQIFKRDLQNGSLFHQHTVDIGIIGDNVDVHPQSGDIYIGGHPKALTYTYYSKDPKNRKAPSEVVIVDPNTYSVSTIYRSISQYPASSVGLFYEKLLFVGAVYESGLLICDFGKK